MSDWGTCKKYFKLLGVKTKRVTEQELKELLKASKNGDTDAKNKIVCANLRLVIHIANSIGVYAPCCDKIDVISEGNLGLLHAIDKYDPKRGMFSTYATWWIRSYITRFLVNKGYIVRIPVRWHQLLWRYKGISEDNVESFSNKEIAKILDISENEVKKIRIMEKKIRVRSMDTAVKGGSSITMYDVIMNKDSQVNKPFVNSLLTFLTEKERKIIELRYGFNGKALSLREIGEVHGYSREYIRKIIVKAVSKMKKVVDAKSAIKP